MRRRLVNPVTLGCAARAQGGFALLALLIFLAVVGLAAAGLATTTSLMERRLDEEQLLWVGRQYRQAIQQYIVSTPAGQLPYPKRLEDLLRDPRYPGIRRYMRQIYPDPLTGKINWELIMAPDQSDGIVGLMSRAAGQPIKQVNFSSNIEEFEMALNYQQWRFIASSGFPMNRLGLPTPR